MKSLHELFTELEYWDSYKPNNMPSSMAKVQHIHHLENEILKKIDVRDYKAIILDKEQS